MYIRSNVRPSIILWFCWRELVFFALLASAVYCLYHKFHLQWVAVPFLPVGTVGTAVAFYVGFKNNASYERLWEARKIWGSIASLCKIFAMGVMSIDGARGSRASAVQSSLVKRQIAWCNLVRIQLRETSAMHKANRITQEVKLMQYLGKGVRSEIDTRAYAYHFLDEADQAEIAGRSNAALALMQTQIAAVTELQSKKTISDTLSESLIETANECIKEQGAAERLKTFPFPRQYAYFSSAFVWIFMLLLPFGLMDEMAKAPAGLDWMVIPSSTLISWIFLTMEQVGDSSEDPFEMGLNDVPITTICRNVEIDLLEMIGSENVPEKIMPIADVLL